MKLRSLIAAALLAGSAACVSEERRPVSPSEYRGMVLGAPLEKPDFTFTATDGRPFVFRRDTEGFVTLLFFGYTSCPDVCPLHMANLAEVLPTLPHNVSSLIKVVFVTTDPDRDSLPVIRRWLDTFDQRFVGLRAPLADVHQVLASLSLPGPRVEPLPEGKYGVAHAAVVIAFTRDNVTPVFYPFGIQQKDWAHDLPLLVQDQSAAPSP